MPNAPVPIVPHPNSLVVVVENSDELLHVRTRTESGDCWFFGLPIVALLLGLVTWSTVHLCAELRLGHGSALLPAIAQIGASIAIFGTITVFTFMREHLCVAGGEVEYTWRFLGCTLRRRRAPLAEIAGSVVESDESTATLMLKTSHWQARFGGSDIGPATLAAVLREIERRRAAAR